MTAIAVSFFWHSVPYWKKYVKYFHSTASWLMTYQCLLWSLSISPSFTGTILFIVLPPHLSVFCSVLLSHQPIVLWYFLSSLYSISFSIQISESSSRHDCTHFYEEAIHFLNECHHNLTSLACMSLHSLIFGFAYLLFSVTWSLILNSHFVYLFIAWFVFRTGFRYSPSYFFFLFISIFTYYF